MKRSYVEEVVMSIGTPVGSKGFKYLVDAVMLMDKPEWRTGKWTAVYHKIAAINGSTATKVERNLRTVLEATRNNMENYDIVNHYIGYTNCQNRNSIMMLYEVIHMELIEDNITEDDKLVITKECLKDIIAKTLNEIVEEKFCLA